MVHVEPIWICKLALLAVRLLLSHRDWETSAPVFRCWLEQTVNPFGCLELTLPDI